MENLYPSAIEVIGGLVKNLIDQNARTTQSQNEYLKKYYELAKRYEKVKSKYNELIKEKEYKQGQSLKLKAFVNYLKTSGKVLDSWDKDIWMLMVENATVYRDRSIAFKFYNGTEILIDN